MGSGVTLSGDEVSVVILSARGKESSSDKIEERYS